MPKDIKSKIQGAYEENPEILKKRTRAVPAPEKQIGIDTKETIYDNIVNAGLSSQIDISSINNFSNLSQNRDTIYNLLDTMCEDSTIATILETYAENATEASSTGRIMWCESDDAKVGKFVTYLLDSMNIDKNIYKWTYSLCKYGDLYLRLYRESEFNDALLDDAQQEETKKFNNRLNESLAQTLDEDHDSKEELNEDVKIKIFSKNDKFVHYVEMMPNPAEMFELTKFGKTYAYIKSGLSFSRSKQPDMMTYSAYTYAFKKKDVEIYSATNFVHAALEDNSSRTPEEVKIFLGDNMQDNDPALNYTVKRGQSLLYNSFKIWREMMLLENSMLLNRLTKSSFVRIINVEVGDMPKEQVGPHIQSIKMLMEQKTALNTGAGMSEYTNPGPIENNIYVPTHNQQGTISISETGGDADVKGIADINFFKNKLYASLRVPKQYLGDTDDAAGFNGGTSLSLISANFAKSVKRIQNTLIQCITDAVNLMLLDKNLDSYINKFTLKMVSPSTQEERDRKEDVKNNVGLIQDITGLVSDLESEATKLKILKLLLQNVVDDPEIMQILQKEVEKLEEKEAKFNPGNEDIDDIPVSKIGNISDEPQNQFINNDLDLDFSNEPQAKPNQETEQIEYEPLQSEDATEPEIEIVDNSLPSPEELGLDMTDNT